MSDLLQQFKKVNESIRGTLADLGGANSPEIKAMAKQLRKAIVKVVSVSGGGQPVASIKSRKLRSVGGTPSAPGQPPHRQTGQFSKSIGYGVVGTGMRVGPLRFTGLMLEEGVQATRGTRKAATRGRRRQKAGTVQRTVTIAPRPYLQKAIDMAAEKMGDDFAATAGARISAKGRER